MHGDERVKVWPGRPPQTRAAPPVHLNQKPLALMRRILAAATAEGNVVWEPFGGLASASVAAIGAGRFACVAEVDYDFAEIAAQRLDDASARRDPESSS